MLTDAQVNGEPQAAAPVTPLRVGSTLSAPARTQTARLAFEPGVAARAMGASAGPSGSIEGLVLLGLRLASALWPSNKDAGRWAEALSARVDHPVEEVVFVEDMARNLKPAKQLGMTTVWINNGSEGGTHDADHSFIDHEIPALGDWLAALTQETAG